MKNFTITSRIIAAIFLLLTAHFAYATTLTWATYFGGSGSTAAEGAWATATDGSGNVYITGRTNSSGLATPGAYQTTLVGGGNAFLAKFSSTGSLLWATYYGGGGETGHGVATDGSGNVYITGNTLSTSGIATTGAYQTSLAGSSDAFLAKFSSSGSLLWATYYGGAGQESEYLGNVVCTDGSGNVYITGQTLSTTGIATPGAFMTTLAATGTSNGNGFLAKFSSTGSLLWATYYGGSGGTGIGERPTGVATDGSGNVFLYGETSSVSGIATTGAYMTTYTGGGNNNLFLVKFNSSGVRQWGTYYGGPAGGDAAGMSVDGTGNIYLTGTTGDASGFATTGAYMTATGCGVCNNVFLAKFSNTGSLLWGTYYGGGGGADYGYGVLADGAGDIYIVGATNSTTGIATPGAYQTTFAGSNDGFLAKFNSAGTSLLYGTYYGGTSGEQIRAVATDGSGNFYFAGATSSTSGIATPGSYQPTYGGGPSDGFLGVFHDVSLPAITGTTTLCVGGTTTLSDATPGGAWSSSAPAVASVGSSTGIVTGVAAGTATITYTVGALWTTAVVTVQTAPSATISGPTSVCVGQTVTLTGATPGGTWTSLYPAKATVGSSSGIVTGVAVGTDTIQYSVTNACGTATAKRYISVITGGACSTGTGHGHGHREPPFYIADGLNVYPNPNKGAFTLVLGTDNDESVQVVITNIMGQKVKEFLLQTNEPVEIKLNQPPGIYFIAARIETQNLLSLPQVYFLKVVVE